MVLRKPHWANSPNVTGQTFSMKRQTIVILLQSTYIYLLLSSTFLLTSCITTSDLIKQDNFKPNKFSLENFNANYSNLDSSSKGFGMWQLLYDCKSFKNDTSKNINSLNLNFDGKNNLIVTLKSNDIIINKFNFKVKLRGDYISIKRNLFLIPIPFIWTRYHEAKVILSNDQDGNLHLNYARSQFVWTLMAGSVEQKFNQTHFKLHN